jgi:hypothetical protein
MRDNKEYETAGMVEQTSGLLSATALPTSQAWVPARVELREDELLWWRHVYHRPERDCGPECWGHEASAKGMLDSFVRLRDARGVLNFARRYGPLAICEHRLPATHNWTATGRGCYPVGWEEGVCREPVALWLRYAQQAHALLGIAATLYQGKKIPEALEQVALDRYQGDGLAMAIARRDWHSTLSDLVGVWLAEANARLSLKWDAGAREWTLILRGTTFTILATQLLYAVTRAHRLAICYGCGQVYLRGERAPKSGQRNFCPDCRTTVAARLRKRGQRANPEKREAERRRQREGRETRRREGTNVRQESQQ